MNTNSFAVLDTGRRVQRFLDANDAVLTSVNGSAARRALDQAVAQLETHGNELESKKQQHAGETAKQRALRLALLKLMRPINRVGQLSLGNIPDFSPLEVPTIRTSTGKLLEKAYAIAQAAAPHAQVFVDGGLPADFLSRLSAATNAIAASLGDRDRLGTARVTATEGTVVLASKVRQAVRALDSLVKLALADDDLLLVAWKSAKRYHAVRLAMQPSETQPSATSVAPAAA